MGEIAFFVSWYKFFAQNITDIFKKILLFLR